VKYKNIPSALHNFGESFMSLTNYMDDTYIVDVLPEVLRELPSCELRISFPDGKLDPDGAYPEVLVKSVAHYASRFHDHLSSHNIGAAALSHATLVIRGTKMGVSGRFKAQDDRGREYDVVVAA
jgi:hypothetical protein